ncbi:MAG: phosphoribosylanthranilate isomerase [Thermoplasmata archaeon]
MKVKICGITNAEDAFACEDSGADALGFVHVPGRSRSITLDRIADICASLGPMTTSVLVCLPSDDKAAMDMIGRSGADIIQVHSLDPQSLDSVRGSGIGVVKAVRPNRGEAAIYAEHADALLFENGVPGTGTGFDYSQTPVDCCRRAIIAGGLNIDNLERAKVMNPYALDVSSGVESAPGRKDPELVREFIRRCRL